MTEAVAVATDRWRFHNPVDVRFGRGARAALPAELEGRRCLFVTSARGRAQLEADTDLGSLANGPQLWLDEVSTNPDIAWLERARAGLRGQDFDAVVGFGGGSALDTAKVLVASMGDALHVPLQRLIDAGPPDRDRGSLRLYAVPTTSGTGSEVTPTATVWDHAERKKRSLAGSAVLPDVAVVDPDLTDDLPVDVTLTTGLDAVNQAAESIWTKGSNPVSEPLATRALQSGMPALVRLMGAPRDQEARTHLAECSLLAGMAISQTRTALCHSISYPLTAHFGVPHGLACAFTMPAVLRHNLAGDDGRFGRLAVALLGSDARAADLIGHFARLNGALGVPDRVRRLVGSLERLLPLVPEMFSPGRADNNLVAVDAATVEGIITESWRA